FLWLGGPVRATPMHLGWWGSRKAIHGSRSPAHGRSTPHSVTAPGPLQSYSEEKNALGAASRRADAAGLPGNLPESGGTDRCGLAARGRADHRSAASHLQLLSSQTAS